MEMESKKKKRNLHIPDDIIFNILRRLPPKSLARFKCVCKSWQSFANQHKYHNQKLILFSSNTIQSVDFEADEIKAVCLDIPFKVSSNPILGIASCNGLLCILTEREGLVIWNPLIGRYKRVSNTSEYINFGFWYDHYTDNYKIVRFMRFLDDPNSESRASYSAEIYSQKSNSWQQKESFDTLNEKFDVIISPDNVHVFDLGVFKGHLCTVEHHTAGHIEMWAREVGKNQNWIKFMNLPPFERKSLSHYWVPFCSMKEDEILVCERQLLFSLPRQRNYEFFLYNPEAKTYKKFHICDTMMHLIHQITYTDSLVSP
ncbi:hypothetical protein LWI29_015974 [Acer saccharum]|uniref:F-box domain-containing protein n=1 Tax=Acer saccharum TaxID=4024 RepID=A0AA39W196_ACESA|nr:hypothetical protein LWI29_015974 [Acer saccharum]